MLQQIDLSKILIQTISLPSVRKKVDVSVLRLDTIHPVISGNKWFKLRYYLQEAEQLRKKTIITWGGAWSNHIAATATACKLHNFKSIGLIRGEESTYSSGTIALAKESGMEIRLMDRAAYREKKIPGDLTDPSHYFINEGGYGSKGAQGAATILDHCSKKDYSHLCCAIGTGTMAAGLVKGALTSQSILGISVLKNNIEAEEKIKALTGDSAATLQIINEYHFGGYAKYNPALISFMNEFHQFSGIPTDFVYTGKLFFAIQDLINKDFFLPGSRLLVIHSGGLQGNDSLNKGTLIF